MTFNLTAGSTEQITLIITSITKAVNELLTHQSQVILAVSGGKSPIHLFQRLSMVNLPWKKIMITLVDERITDPASEDSNENLVRQYLLQNKAATAKFSGLFMPDFDIKNMLNHANQLVKQIDIAILGIGEDGHTASIFPDCPEFEQAIDLQQQPAYIETNPSSAKYARISLNLSSLIQIKYLILSATGELKLNVLKEAAKQNNPNYPISYVLNQRPDINIVLS